MTLASVTITFTSWWSLIYMVGYCCGLAFFGGMIYGIYHK